MAFSALSLYHFIGKDCWVPRSNYYYYSSLRMARLRCMARSMIISFNSPSSEYHWVRLVFVFLSFLCFLFISSLFFSFFSSSVRSARIRHSFDVLCFDVKAEYRRNTLIAEMKYRCHMCGS